ncbi:MAG TPA: VanZ family protein [Bryobacteraceae bacterium]|nr:VanZ family protein [Bryobacteraceae bacterium]
MFRLLLLAVGLIVYGSLYPWHFRFHHSAASPLWILLHSWPSQITRFTLRDTSINILLYVPLGAVACLAVLRRHSRVIAWTSAVLLALTLSATIEMLQIYDAGRTVSLLDVCCNLAGGIIGASAALAFHPEIDRLVRQKSGRHAAPAGFLLCCWLGYQLYPLVPVISRTHLRLGLSYLISSPFLAPVPIFESAAEWFAAAVVTEAVIGRLRSGWLAAIMLCLPFRLFLPGRSLAGTELLGAALALLLWSTMRESKRLSAAVWILGAALLLRELAPLNFVRTPGRFSWIPFRASFESDWLPAAIVLFRKAFNYGAMIWLLRGKGVPYRTGGIVVGAVLAVCEIVQLYLPGKTPEITDTLLALIMAFVLSRFKEDRQGT